MTNRPVMASRWLRAGAALMITWVVTESAATARADERPGAYQLSFDLDVPILLIGGALASSYFLLADTPTPICVPCDKADVNPFDRPFAGVFSRTWQRVGDYTTYATLGAVPVILLVGEPTHGGLVDLVVVLESALATSAVQVPVAYAVGRPRPRDYGTAAPIGERTNANAARSFFSGHVANTLAMTLATTRALRRTGHGRLAWAALAFGVTASAFIGVSRVAAGSHFPSDVLVGYAVGTAFGIAIPALHEEKVGVTPIADAQAHVSGLAVVGSF